MTMMTTGPVVKVGRDKLAACMTCPVCNELFTDATTISECLHTCELCFSLSVFFSVFPLRVSQISGFVDLICVFYSFLSFGFFSLYVFSNRFSFCSFKIDTVALFLFFFFEFAFWFCLYVKLFYMLYSKAVKFWIFILPL